MTTPIRTEELEPLVAATATHRAVIGEARLVSHEPQRRPPEPPPFERQDVIEVSEVDPEAASEFSWHGSSLSEALSAVTDGGQRPNPLASAKTAVPSADRRERDTGQHLHRGAKTPVARDAGPLGPKHSALAHPAVPGPRGPASGLERTLAEEAARPRYPAIRQAPTVDRDSSTLGGSTSSSLDPETTVHMAAAHRFEAEGNLSEAIARYKQVLAHDRENAEAQARCQRLEGIYADQAERRLGELNDIPVVSVPTHQITWHKLDHQAGFILSRIDGLLTYGDIITISGMSRCDALRTLVKLLDLGLIESQR